MPLRFACEHCRSTLSVSSRKSGQAVTCPKCRQKTTVPIPEPAAVASESSSASERATFTDTVAPPAQALPADAPPSLDPLPIPPPPPLSPSPASEPTALADEDTFVPPVDDTDANQPDEVTWVYEGIESRSAPVDASSIDYSRVSLPRYVLYGQGGLLLVVALVSLLLGIVIGRGAAPREVVKSGTAKPCFLTGHVYRGADALADAGAVIIVVPQDQRPSEKAPVEGLRPDDPLPGADQPSLTRIKSIGGDYTRADEQGYFKLRVPDTGEYFVLVVSRGKKRPASQRLDPVHLAQMGRYFLPAPDLINDRDYRWRAETIRRDKEYTFTFD